VPSGANAPPPPPSFPRSDRFLKLYTAIVGVLTRLHAQDGDIEGLLSDPTGWDWPAVRGFILPSWKAFMKDIEHIYKEIDRHAIEQERGG
jgi:hypothetical protein